MPVIPYGCPHCTITGYVVDSNDKPIAGVGIEWDLPKVGFFIEMTTTDAAGRYETRIGPIPTGESTQILRAYIKEKEVERQQVLYPTVSLNAIVEVNFTLG